MQVIHDTVVPVHASALMFNILSSATLPCMLCLAGHVANVVQYIIVHCDFSLLFAPTCRLQRNILANKPRVTRFPHTFD